MSTATSSEGSTQAAKAATTGRAVLLLALFVVLGVLGLNAVDNPSTELAAATAQPVIEEPVAPALITPTTIPSRTPSEVKVLVANGVGVNGAASRVASRLQPIGYLLATPGNTNTPSPESAIAFTEGYQPEAQAMATSLGLPATSVRPLDPALVTDLQGSNVVVVVGNDLAAAPPAGTATAAATPSQPVGGAPVANPQGGAGLSTQSPANSGSSASTGTATPVPTN